MTTFEKDPFHEYLKKRMELRKKSIITKFVTYGKFSYYPANYMADMKKIPSGSTGTIDDLEFDHEKGVPYLIVRFTNNIIAELNFSMVEFL